MILMISSPSDAAGDAMIPGLALVAFVLIASGWAMVNAIKEAAQENSFRPILWGLLRVGALLLGLFLLFLVTIVSADFIRRLTGHTQGY